jgi:hypothetical protein
MEDRRALSIISKRLQPGERIVWLGTPSPWVAARAQVYQLIFITIWTGGVLFALWNLVFKESANPSGGLPALAILGFLVTAGAVFWVRAVSSFADCWRTAYALTDRRIIIAAGEGSRTQSFTAAALGDITRTGNEQRGSIIFGNDPFYSGHRFRGFGQGNGLYGISDPARVEGQIYRTLVTPNRQGPAV